MEKMVSQLNHEGYYVGQVTADESPLESGVFLMPGGSIDMSPPALIEEGKRYRIVEGRWAAEDIPNPSLAAPPESLTKEQLEAAARARRDFLLERAGLRMAPCRMLWILASRRMPKEPRWRHGRRIGCN